MLNFSVTRFAHRKNLHMPTQSRKILIVEDELCVEDGFSTLEATNGEAGLNIALREHPDLILLDLEMPKMGGYRDASAVKKG